MTVYPSHAHRNYGCRLREFTLNDYKAVSLENEKIRVTILVDKGTDIYEFLHKPKDVDFLWKSRLGLRSMRNYQSMKPGPEGMFLDFYEGGWQELFPWGGHASEYRGVTTGLHGEVALEPWQYRIEVDTPEEVRIACSIRTRCSPFLLKKTFTLLRHQPVLRIHELVLNEGMEEMSVVWGHHPAFGWPFLDSSCVIDLPPCEAKVADLGGPDSRFQGNFEGRWPMVRLRSGEEIDISRIPAPEVRSQDLVYLHSFKEGWYALRSQSQQLGIAFAWDARVFPWIWYWQCFGGGPGYPFWGAEYVAAIEPITSMTLHFSDAVTNGTALQIPAGGSVESEMSIHAFEDNRRVTRVSGEGIEFVS